jgi:hypothetical protein
MCAWYLHTPGVRQGPSAAGVLPEIIPVALYLHLVDATGRGSLHVSRATVRTTCQLSR